MKKYRILVVDDSVVARRIVSDALANEPEIEVIGVASNGRIALQKMEQITPDLVTLDLVMPEMDGIETLKVIRSRYPKLPVIALSALTTRGADATLEALFLGASDYYPKPTEAGDRKIAVQQLKSALVPRIKSLCSEPYSDNVHLNSGVTKGQKTQIKTKVNATLSQMVDIVVIGASTGGPNALSNIFPKLPKDFPVPIAVVQHMPATFIDSLINRLNEKSAIAIRSASNQSACTSHCVWFAPGDQHMEVVSQHYKKRWVTSQSPPVNSCRPAVDILFRSAAHVYGANVLAVVLTGMGSDGLRGCEDIHAAGGQIIVQDEQSSVVWGMPGCVANAGLANSIVPLDQIALEIQARVDRAGTVHHSSVLNKAAYNAIS